VSQPARTIRVGYTFVLCGWEAIDPLEAVAPLAVAHAWACDAAKHALDELAEVERGEANAARIGWIYSNLAEYLEPVVRVYDLAGSEEYARGLEQLAATLRRNGMEADAAVDAALAAGGGAEFSNPASIEGHRDLEALFREVLGDGTVLVPESWAAERQELLAATKAPAADHAADDEGLPIATRASRARGAASFWSQAAHLASARGQTTSAGLLYARAEAADEKAQLLAVAKAHADRAAVKRDRRRHDVVARRTAAAIHLARDRAPRVAGVHLAGSRRSRPATRCTGPPSGDDAGGEPPPLPQRIARRGCYSPSAARGWSGWLPKISECREREFPRQAEVRPRDAKQHHNDQHTTTPHGAPERGSYRDGLTRQGGASTENERASGWHPRLLARTVFRARRGRDIRIVARNDRPGKGLDFELDGRRSPA